MKYCQKHSVVMGQKVCHKCEMDDIRSHDESLRRISQALIKTHVGVTIKDPKSGAHFTDGPSNNYWNGKMRVPARSMADKFQVFINGDWRDAFVDEWSLA